jgi:hypothetical protein
VFLLSSGGQIEGELINRDESPREKYVIRTQAGGELSLAKKQVERHVVRKEAEVKYEEYLHKMQDTVEDHQKMADWCLKNGLDAYREYHMQEILKLDPNYEPARLALGYIRRNNKWVTPDDVMRNQGYVRYKNTWRLPQELEMLLAQEQAEQAHLEWKRKLRQLRGKIDRGDAKALEELKTIRDPAAGRSLVELLNDKREPSRMRMAYVDILANIGGPAVVSAFAHRAIVDEDDQVRDRCLDYLAKGANRHAARLFVRYLKSDNPQLIDRAGTAIGMMEVPDYTLEMINALVTKHTRIVGGDSGGGMGIGFSSNGGLSVGGNKPQKVVETNRNEGVLRGLAALHPGVNYLYDVDRWREWWVYKTTPQEINLRRSE